MVSSEANLCALGCAAPGRIWSLYVSDTRGTWPSPGFAILSPRKGESEKVRHGWKAGIAVVIVERSVWRRCATVHWSWGGANSAALRRRLFCHRRGRAVRSARGNERSFVRPGARISGLEPRYLWPTDWPYGAMGSRERAHRLFEFGDCRLHLCSANDAVHMGQLSDFCRHRTHNTVARCSNEILHRGY